MRIRFIDSFKSPPLLFILNCKNHEIYICRIVKASLALERGSSEENLHLQGMVVATISTASLFTRSLKNAMGWSGKNANGASNAPPKLHILTKLANGRGMHNKNGLIGYTFKYEGKPDFQIYLKNIDEDVRASTKLNLIELLIRFFNPFVLIAHIQLQEIAKGKILNLQHGAGPLKSKSLVSKSNMLERMSNFHRMAMRGAPSVGPHHVLHAMMRTGKYYPSITFIEAGSSYIFPAYFKLIFDFNFCAIICSSIPRKGAGAGRGLIYKRFAAIWRMAVNPGAVTEEDVQSVFFHDGSTEHSRARYFSNDCEVPWDKGTVHTIIYIYTF